MSVLNITPRERMVDARGRPYFAWDVDLTLEQFEARLADPDPIVRAYFLAKLMRQARPDDVFAFVAPSDIGAAWTLVAPRLGRSRAFWSWLLTQWGAIADEHR